jgi:hypothetical protein
MPDKKIKKTMFGFVSINIKSTVDKVVYGKDFSYEPVKFEKTVSVFGVRVFKHIADVSESPAITANSDNEGQIGFTKK